MKTLNRLFGWTDYLAPAAGGFAVAFFIQVVVFYGGA